MNVRVFRLLVTFAIVTQAMPVRAVDWSITTPAYPPKETFFAPQSDIDADGDGPENSSATLAQYKFDTTMSSWEPYGFSTQHPNDVPIPVATLASDENGHWTSKLCPPLWDPMVPTNYAIGDYKVAVQNAGPDPVHFFEVVLDEM